MSSDADRKPPDDRELEDFLAGRHPVGKAYREASGDETAPPELDALILGAAREAVRTPRVRRPRWVQPVAVAATLALSLGVLMNLWRDPDTRGQVLPSADTDLDRMKARAQEESRDAGASMKKQEAPTAAAAEIEREPAPEATLGAAADPAEHKLERRSEPRTAGPRPVEEASKPKAAVRNAAPGEPAAPEPARRPMDDSAVGAVAAPSGGSISGFVGDPPEPRQAAPAPPPPAPSKSVARPESPSAAPATGGLSDYRDDAEASRSKDENQAKDATDEADMQRAREREQDARSSRRSMLPQSRPAPVTAPAPTAPPAPAAKESQREFSESMQEDHVVAMPPEEWIRQIRAARDRGDEAGAREWLRRFRDAYPEHAIPEDLRVLDAR